MPPAVGSKFDPNQRLVTTEEGRPTGSDDPSGSVRRSEPCRRLVRSAGWMVWKGWRQKRSSARETSYSGLFDPLRLSHDPVFASTGSITG